MVAKRLWCVFQYRSRSATAKATTSAMPRTVSTVAKFSILWLLWAVPAFAQGTLIPFAPLTFVDANGNPLSGGKLCTYAAGTTTAQATYSQATLSVPNLNSNPVIMASNGRPTSGGIFLSPTSYKFVFREPGTDTTCATGTILWTLDNIRAVPTTSGNVDVTGTAGEALTAGEIVYLSNGDGALTNGRWYKTDADLAYASSTAAIVAAVTADVALGAEGTFRLVGTVTGLSGLTAGAPYYVSATAGALTATAPSTVRLMGAADSTTTLVLGGGQSFLGAPLDPGLNNFRLTLTTGVCVTTADVTAATTIFFAPCAGNRIALYNASGAPSVYSSAQISIAVPATTSTMYDIFAYANASGTPTLELLAWTNDTTRATAIVQTVAVGVYTKSGDATRRYLGSFRTTGVSGQTEDSLAKRYLWNYHNRIPRLCRVMEATASWTYTTATWRQARATATNQLDVVVGVAGIVIDVSVSAAASNSTPDTRVGVAIGEDSTSTVVAGSFPGYTWAQTSNLQGPAAMYRGYVPLGRHVYVWLEISEAAGTTTWAVSVGNFQSGIFGVLEG